MYQSLKAIFLHIDNHEKSLLSNYDLSVARFYALMHINSQPGINYIDLSDLMLCTKSNTTRVVRGYLARRFGRAMCSLEDGRSYQLYLTSKGETLFKEAHPEYLKQVDKLMSAFDETQLRTYTKVSQHIERILAPVVINAGGDK